MLTLDGLYLYTKSCTDDIVSWWWQYLSDVSWHLSIAVAAYLSTCFFTYTFIKNVNYQAWQLPGPPGRLLLVTAHPDDEVMFFGPLLYLSKFNNTKIYLLCLSIGNYTFAKQYFSSIFKFNLIHKTILICFQVVVKLERTNYGTVQKDWESPNAMLLF